MPHEHPPVLFVGAGPGDPELITIKGRNALARADLVIYAGSLVPEAVLAWAPSSARLLNSAGLTLEEVISAIESAWLEGQHVVRLHTGDPSLYGAIFEQMAELNRQSIPYRVIPGVTAAFAAAAAMGIEYTLPEISQTLIITRMEGRTPVPAKEELVHPGGPPGHHGHLPERGYDRKNRGCPAGGLRPVGTLRGGVSRQSAGGNHRLDDPGSHGGSGSSSRHPQAGGDHRGAGAGR